MEIILMLALFMGATAIEKSGCEVNLRTIRHDHVANGLHCTGDKFITTERDGKDLQVNTYTRNARFVSRYRTRTDAKGADLGGLSDWNLLVTDSASGEGFTFMDREMSKEWRTGGDGKCISDGDDRVLTLVCDDGPMFFSVYLFFGDFDGAPDRNFLITKDEGWELRGVERLGNEILVLLGKGSEHVLVRSDYSGNPRYEHLEFLKEAYPHEARGLAVCGGNLYTVVNRLKGERYLRELHEITYRGDSRFVNTFTAPPRGDK